MNMILHHDEGVTSAGQPVRNFLVECVLPLHETDANNAKASLLKLMSLIALARQALGVKHESSDWSADSNPTKWGNAAVLRGTQQWTRFQHIRGLCESNTFLHSSIVHPAHRRRLKRHRLQSSTACSVDFGVDS